MNIFGLEFRVSQVLAGLIFIACLSALVYFEIRKPKSDFFVKKSADNK
jgi:hypothetical protein